MKVAISQSVQVDTEVNVTVEDITAAMQELIDESEQRQELFKSGAINDRQLSFAVGQVVNAAYRCLKAITDEWIALYPEKTRHSIATSLQEQVDRWRVGLEAPGSVGSVDVNCPRCKSAMYFVPGDLDYLCDRCGIVWTASGGAA